MPPEDQLSEDELNELIEAFKKVNSDLYSQLISLTGANEESLKNFISQLSKNEKLNTESLVKILTATSDSDENLQDYLENFLNGFEKVTSSSSDQLSKIISGFSSQSSMFQKNLERIQAKTNELGKATEQGIGNIHKLMTSLSNTYATMAQVQGTIMQTAVFDSSSMDGRSLEGELLVELSNVSEFDGAINKFQTQITGLSDELLLAGKYISDVQKTRILNTRKELALEQGILEARKLSAAVIQDSNGNFLDLEKSLDKATKLAEEFSKNLREGNSHLNRQINLGKELALAQQQTYSAQYLSGEQISQNVKSLQKISDELLEQETISGKMAYLNEEIAKSQKFQEDNANAVKNAQEDLTNKLEEQKRIQDELATTSDLTRKLELETNLKDVQTDIQGISSLVGEMEASKKMTVQLEAQLRTVGELEESQLRVNEKEIHKLDITGEISELEKANKELERIMTEGTTTSIISNVSGGAQARGTSAITTEQLKVIEQISSKEEVVAHLKDIQRQNLEKIKAHQEEITKTNEQITDEQQHQVSLTEKSEGLTKGAAEDTAKNLQNAKKLTEELAKAREEQIKSSTFGVYTDSAIKSLDAIEQKILSATESIPFFGSAIKNHLEKPLRDVKEQISEEFINTFTSVASEIKDISEKEQLLLAIQTETDQSTLEKMHERLIELDGVEIKKPFEVMSAGFGNLQNKIKDISGSLKTLFNPALIGIAAIAGLLFGAFKRFVSLEGAAEDFRKEVGLGSDQTAEIEKIAQNVNTEFQKFGVSLEKSFAAATSLTERFGTLVGATRENVEMVALMSANLGVSEANASGALDILTQIGDGTSETARNAMALATGMSKAAGVPLDKVMEDVAGASDETLSLIRGSTTELVRAAVEARRLGTNLETLSGAASKFLDFESSVRAEMEASVFAGRALNFQKARQLAFEGDLVGMQREALNVIKSAGDFTEMSYHQQQKLAEAAGMTVGEINKQLTREKQLEALKHGTSEQQAMYNRYLQMQEDLQEGNNKSLADQGMEMMKQELMQSKLTQLKERFNALMVQLGEKLLPMIEIGFSILVPVVKVLLSVANLILMPFTLLSDVVRALTGDFSGLGERFGSFGDIAHTVLGTVLGGLVLLKTNFLGLGSAISSVGPLITSLFSGIGTFLSGIPSMFSNLTGTFTGIFSQISTSMSNLWTSASSVFSNLSSSATGLFSNIASSASSLFTNLSTSTRSIFSSITSSASGVFANLSSSVGGLFSNLSSSVGGLFSNLSSNASGLFTKLGRGFSSVIDGIAGGASSVKNAISGMFTSGTTALSTMWDSTKGFFSASMDGAKSLGSKLMDAFKNPMGALGGLKDKVSGLFGKVGSTDSITEEITLDSYKPDKSNMGTGPADKAGGLLEKFNKVDMKQVLKGAAALAILSGALFIAAKAFQEFSEVEWGGVAMGIVGLTSLVVAAKFLEKGSVSMIKGAAAIAILGAALIPAAFAFQLFSDVSWGSVLVGLTALTGLGMAAAMIAPFAPLITAGAWAIGALGLALVPFAVAAIAAGYAMTLVADAFSVMVGSIKQLEFEDIGKIALLGATFAGLGLMIPFILLGAFAMGAMTLAMIPFAGALAIAGMGISMLVSGLDGLGPALKNITGDESPLNQLILSFGMLGLAMPIITIGAVALGIMSVALVTLGASATVAAGGMALLNMAIGDDGLGDLIDKMVALGDVGPGLLAAAAGIAAVGFSLVAFSTGSLISGFLNIFGGGDDPIDKFVKLGKHAPKLEKAGDAIKSFATASSAMRGLDDMLEDVADGMEDIFDVLEDAPSGISERMKSVGDGMKGLLSGFSGISLNADINYEDALEGIADGIDEIFGVMEDIDVSLAPKLSIIGDGMKALLPSFGGEVVSGITEDIGNILDAVGEGLGEFFSNMKDIDPVVIPILPQIGPGVSELLTSLGSGNLGEFDADLEEIFAGLGSGIGNFMESVGDFDADQIMAMSGIGGAIAEILTGIGSIGEINFDADDLLDIMEDLGPAIDAFLLPLKSVDEDVLLASTSVGDALGSVFSSLGSVGDAPDLDWTDVLEGFGEGIEELFDELSSLNTADFGKAILVGDVMGQVFASMKDVKLDESVGDAIGNLGDGIEDFFDEVEHVDMQTAPQVLEVTRTIGRTISYLPMDRINSIPDDIESKLNNLGDGIEDMMDEMDGMSVPKKEVMMSVAATIKEIVPVLSSEMITKIPSNIENILDSVGDAVEDMFDEMEGTDLSVAKQMGTALSGMGSFFQGLSEINDGLIDISVIRDMGTAFSEIIKSMTNIETGNINEDALALKLQSLGDGMKNIIESFGELDLSTLSNIDMGSIFDGVASGIGSMVNLVDGDDGIFGFLSGDKSEEEQTKYFDEISKRMQSIGLGVKSIISSFPDISIVRTLGQVNMEDISENMIGGIKEMFEQVSNMNIPLEELNIADKFIQISDALNIISDVNPNVNMTLSGLQSIASNDFVSGLTNATNAIYDFALAVQSLSEVDGMSSVEVSSNLDSLPSEEKLKNNEFSDFTLPTLDMAQPADNSTPIIIETTQASTTSGVQKTDTGNLEAKLDNLIALMRSGGIAVNLDGKRVSKTLAQSIESS